MRRQIGFSLLAIVLLTVSSGAAQKPKVYRVGVLLPGSPWYEAIDGLRQGLRELGLEEGKHFVLEIRDTKGNVKAAEAAARNLEEDKVTLIYAVADSVVAAARRATTSIPIVFNVGSDPVDTGFVESFAKPGGRLTGVHLLVRDLTGKRLEILKGDSPKGSWGPHLLQSWQPGCKGIRPVGSGGGEAPGT